MKPKVYIRVDASAQIGLGHLVRCIALADMLANEFNIFFISAQIPKLLANDLRSKNFDLQVIDDDLLFFNRLTSSDIVVLDGYHFDIAYQKKIKSLGCKLVCIDDLYDKEFVADVIINHAPSITPSVYRAQPYTQFALGLNYVLLRPLFLKQATKKRVVNNIDTLLICFGGSDVKDITRQALQVALKVNHFKKIIVVTGAAYMFEDGIKNLLSNTGVEYHHAVNEADLIKLMLKADLAIIPASGILQEAISVKCKIISGMYVDNQKLIFKNYKKLGAFESAGNFSNKSIENAINRSLKQANHIDKIFIDGKSGIRLLNIFNNLAKEDEGFLRKIIERDLMKTFEWANNKRLRRFFFNSNVIKLEEHTTWFINKLYNKNCLYYVYELKGELLGSIRFDIENKKAKISYLVDPIYQSQGWGTIILKKGVELLVQANQNISTIYGEVFIENLSSVKVFEKLGYNLKRNRLANIIRFEKRIN